MGWRVSVLLVAAFAALAPAEVVGKPNQQLSSTQEGARDRLGIRRLQLFVVIPNNRNGAATNTTALATLWLRRVGGGQAGPHALPHQRQDAIRGFMWLDDPADLALRGPASHLWLPVHCKSWRPRLLLEHEGAEAALPVVVNEEHFADESLTDPIRPYSFHVDLPPGAGTCFKILESSLPDLKVGFCLPHYPRLCNGFAPPEQHTPDTPALWTVIGPVRDYSVTAGEGWAEQARRTATWVHHHLSYHLSMGATGLMLYADQWQRGLLTRQALLQPYLRAGSLRLIHWDMPERIDRSGSHPEYNGYNYDQALHSSHALLGLSACGTNLRLLLTDIDEFLYTPGGQPWPAPMSCLASTPPAAPGTTAMVVVRRWNVQASSVQPTQEPALWVTAPAASVAALESGDHVTAGDPHAARSSVAVGGRAVTPMAAGAAAGAAVPGAVVLVGGVPLSAHPLTKYDQLALEPLPLRHSKRLLLPAAEIVAYFVHEGWALRGQQVEAAHSSCLTILHVTNAVHARMPAYDASHYGPFHNWLLHVHGGG